MIVEYTRYRISEDRSATFLDAYEKASYHLKTSPHCLAYELSRCTEEADRYILRIEWTSIAAHIEGFRKNASFPEFFLLVKPFIQQIEEMRHYEPMPVDHRS